MPEFYAYFATQIFPLKDFKITLREWLFYFIFVLKMERKGNDTEPIQEQHLTVVRGSLTDAFACAVYTQKTHMHLDNSID